MPDEPGATILKFRAHIAWPNVPPVTTTSCSPQSGRPGPKRRLPWLRYRREYHLKNPEEIDVLVAVQYTVCALTKGRYDNVVASGNDNKGVGPASTSEDVEERDKEGEEGTCTESVMRTRTMW